MKDCHLHFFFYLEFFIYAFCIIYEGSTLLRKGLKSKYYSSSGCLRWLQCSTEMISGFLEKNDGGVHGFFS